MSLFKSILNKLGIGANDNVDGTTAKGSEAQSTTTTTVIPSTNAEAPGLSTASSTFTAPMTAPSTSPVMSHIDVVEKLDTLAASHTEQLNWRTSIVDLLKLLGLDSSLGARKELAGELGYPQEKMTDSAQMNIWLHRTVLQKLAENGGNVPAELLH